MASVSTNKATGKRMIQFVGQDGKRQSVRFGKVNKKQAESAKRFIEDLIAAKVTGSPVQNTTAEWVAAVPDVIRVRLEKVGLLGPNSGPSTLGLGKWLDDYIQGRQDGKVSTICNIKQAKDNLIEFFGYDKPLAEINGHDAEMFRNFLATDKKLAEATVRRRTRRARQFFKAAMKKRILDENPFADIPCCDVANESRRYYVSNEEIEAVIDACPDMHWRLIFAFARYGGLRTPSETLLVRWQDILWDKQRFIVTSPKTAHMGKATRVVPMFPRLYQLLLEAFELAEEGAEYVVARYRDSRANLRTHAHRIIQQAGLEPWPKTFQNCRASLETELMDEFPIQTVTAWLGNSPAIAMKHYLSVREEHFQKALHFPMQYVAARGSNGSQREMDENDKLAICGTIRNDASPCDSKDLHQTPQGQP